MNLYVVTREGVYRHEIIGIYSNEKLAIDRAKSIKHDNYHTYNVSSCVLNKNIEDTLVLKTISSKGEINNG